MSSTSLAGFFQSIRPGDLLQTILNAIKPLKEWTIFFFSFLIRFTSHNSNNGNTWMIKYGGCDSYETQSKDLIGDPHLFLLGDVYPDNLI